MESLDVLSLSSPQEGDHVSTDFEPNHKYETQTYEPLTYDELFPALPNSDDPDMHGSPMASWNKNSDMRIASSIITQVFRIPYEERAIVDNSQFGEFASTRLCTEISGKTGARIEISSAKDQSLTFIVTGKNDEVQKARRQVIEKFQTQARQTLSIPKEHHKSILGRKGKNLQELEMQTGTKVRIPNADEPSDDITIIGTSDNIEKAIHRLRAVSDQQSKQAFERLDIPKLYHPFICGPYNENISSLMSTHGVRINVPPASVNKDEITIAGEKEGVLACKDIIIQTYETMKRKCQTVCVEIPRHQHKYIVGPRRSGLAEILQATSVCVEVPSADQKSPDTVTLRGPPEKLGEALTKVYIKANSITTASLDAPTWLHKYIIGKKGVNIKQLTQDHPDVHVELMPGLIKLEGCPEEVEVLKGKLSMKVEELESTLKCETLTVDPVYMKNIIGKNGVNIQRIRNETGVAINLGDEGTGVICLEGQMEAVDATKQQLLDLVSKIENEKERDIIIDQRFHRNIIGTKGAKIREIREMFNLVQISLPDPGDRSDIVKIRGPKDDVNQCYKYLEKMVKELMENSYEIRVPVYRQLHKFIIGKSGANINRIREESGAKVKLPTEKDKSDDIIITGKKENCEKARDLIQKIQLEQANVVEQEIIIPHKFHNSLIGAGGKLIQSISEECGNVTIKFPPLDSKSDKVCIRGHKDDVIKAKQKLIEASNEKELTSFTDTVRAKVQHHKFLIGKNGINIKKIREQTEARIIFPADKDEDRELITLIGKKESVKKAKEELQKVIKELDNIVEVRMSVDPKHYRYFTSRKGEILRSISDQYGGVIISFPRPGESNDQVCLTGAKECVAQAKQRIDEIVTEQDQMVTIDAVIPQRHHRTVMGARGSKVQQITAEFDVHIKFPEKDLGSDTQELPNGDMNGEVKPQDIVQITGKEENCIAARDALFSLIPVNIDMVVPFRYHRFIIGQKGESVRYLMNEHDVKIQVPPAKDQSDIIKISGPKVNVENAKAALEQKLEELEKEEEDRQARSFKITLNIDPAYHPKIIGRRGAIISKIREKYDVNIQFPAKGSENADEITITGYQKNAEEAKDAILAITGDLESMVREAVEISSAIHSRLIGSRGRAIRKVMDEFKVEIKFPRGGDDPDTVVIMGPKDAVEDCKEHLLLLAEEYIQDITDMEELNRYTVRPEQTMSHQENLAAARSEGFVVTNAPWTQPAPNMDSSEDFPSMGYATGPSSTPVWGPRR